MIRKLSHLNVLYFRLHDIASSGDDIAMLRFVTAGSGPTDNDGNRFHKLPLYV